MQAERPADPKRFRFNRTKFSDLTGATVVRFTPENLPEGQTEAFLVEASRAGVKIKGELMLSERAMLEPLAKAIGNAWTDHRALIPKLSKTLSGH